MEKIIDWGHAPPVLFLVFIFFVFYGIIHSRVLKDREYEIFRISAFSDVGG